MIKKYAIIIGEDDARALNKVLGALGAAGFNSPRPNCHWGVVEVWSSGYVGNLSELDERMTTHRLLWPSYVLSHAAELLDPLKGKSMEEWLRNDDKVVFNCLPEVAKGEICRLMDGRAVGNLRWWNDCAFDGNPSFWDYSNIDPRISYGTTYSIRDFNLWEHAPEGARLVTKLEKAGNSKNVPYKSIQIGGTGKWDPTFGGAPLELDGRWNYEFAYAVPLDFVFGENVVEVPVSELIATYEKQHGMKVKVRK